MGCVVASPSCAYEWGCVQGLLASHGFKTAFAPPAGQTYAWRASAIAGRIGRNRRLEEVLAVIPKLRKTACCWHLPAYCLCVCCYRECFDLDFPREDSDVQRNFIPNLQVLVTVGDAMIAGTAESDAKSIASFKVGVKPPASAPRRRKLLSSHAFLAHLQTDRSSALRACMQTSHFSKVGRALFHSQVVIAFRHGLFIF